VNFLVERTAAFIVMVNEWLSPARRKNTGLSVEQMPDNAARSFRLLDGSMRRARTCDGDDRGDPVIAKVDRRYRSPEYAFRTRAEKSAVIPLDPPGQSFCGPVKHRILLAKTAQRSIATLTQLDTDRLTFCDARLYPVAAR
jgi:hypothetical protein